MSGPVDLTCFLYKCVHNMLLVVAGEIPKGALYVGTSERIEGGYKHTDQFFLVPAYDTNCNITRPQSADNSCVSQADTQTNSTLVCFQL